MLKQLNVRNFALIQEATLNFDSGYTVITGETGSGKSILLNALNLLLGERADFKVIGNTGEKAIVEATFQINEEEFTHFFEEHDIDSEHESIIRREITTQGRSRAFINDIPVQLTVLKDFTERLISIHSQYNTLDLKRKDYQLHTLDVLAGTKKMQFDFSQLFEASKILSKQIQSEKEQLEKLERDRDYNDFQLNELEELNLEKNNFQELEEQLTKIENAGEIQQIISNISSGLSNENAIIEQLQSLKIIASRLTKFDKTHEKTEERIQSVIIELKDLNEELSDAINQFENDNEHQKLIISELVDKYNRILIKHRFSNQDDLKSFYHQLKNTVSDTNSLNEKIQKLENELQQITAQLVISANQLHKKRLSAIPDIEQRIAHLLSDLKLPDTTLTFQLEQQEKLTATGHSSLTLLFSANKGVSPVEIEKAASGGELSRVMLALQQLISEKTQLPTIFFDEIDTGVSGDVAEKIGLLLKQMGKTIQLFAISHLPQVAAKAKQHFKVEKSTTDNNTQTTIRSLSNSERIEEVARLMSGEVINEAAISNAKALMI
jgi:DNA repair protein RecN (Recombination protein N)